MNILALWYLFIAVIAAVGVGGAIILVRQEDVSEGRFGQRKWPLLVAGALLLCAVTTIVWGEIALRHFARDVGGNIKGMIGGPVPDGAGGDHQYTPKGKHYARWIFTVPVISGLSALALVLVIGLAALSTIGHRRALAGTILWAFAMTGAVLVWLVTRFFETFEFFI